MSAPTPPAPPSDEVPAGTSLRSDLAAWLVPLLALPMLVAGLDRWPMWDAEVWTAQASALPFGQMLTAVAADRHPPLFFALEWLIHRVDDSDAALRVLPAVATFLTIGLTWRVVARHVGRPAAWIAAALTAVSPYVVAYAGNARSAPVTALLGVVALGATLDLCAGERPRRAALVLGTALTLGLYVHYAMALTWGAAVLGAGAAFLFAREPDAAARRRRLAYAAAAAGASVVAFLPWVLGPFGGQDVTGGSEARTFAVLRYLLWPVGPNFVADGAGLLAGLTLVGLVSVVRRGDARGAALGGAAAAAVAVPWLWSNELAAAGKFYLYAPAFPLYALLVGAGLAPLVARALRALRPALLPRAGLVGALLVAALLAPALAEVQSLPSNLVSVAPLRAGVYDARIEARLLESVPSGDPIDNVMKARPAQDWFRYSPALAARGMRGRSPQAWHPMERSDEQDAASGQDLSEAACVFREAFAAVLALPSQAQCAALRDAVFAAAEETGYGPFLLEVAVWAEQDGDAARVEDYARRAAAAMPASARADVLLVRALLFQGRLVEGQEAAERGITKAMRYGLGADWRQLARWRVQAAVRIGEAEGLREAQDTLECLQKRMFVGSARRCEGRLRGWL